MLDEGLFKLTKYMALNVAMNTKPLGVFVRFVLCAIRGRDGWFEAEYEASTNEYVERCVDHCLTKIRAQIRLFSVVLKSFEAQRREAVAFDRRSNHRKRDQELFAEL